MESFLKQYDKEYMKMAMLKHEETFREQVGELHRLYRVQKMLMRDMKRNDALKRQQIPEHHNGVLERSNVENKRIPHEACHSYHPQGRPRKALDLERPAEDYIDDGVEPESEIELTLATGSRRRKKEEASFTSDSATSFSSSSTESGGENSKFQDWGGLLQVQDIHRGFYGVSKREYNVAGTVREDRMEQPPWLFQCLSLNMT